MIFGLSYLSPFIDYIFCNFLIPCFRCISEASTIDGVLELRLAHFWQLDFTTMAGTVDVRVRRDADEQLVLALVTGKLSAVISILTVQVKRRNFHYLCLIVIKFKFIRENFKRE